MWQLLRLLTGPRFCPWCSVQRTDRWTDKITERMPAWLICYVLGRYDRTVAWLAIPLHNKLHEPGTNEAR